VAAKRKSNTFFIVHSPWLSPEFLVNPTGALPAGETGLPIYSDTERGGLDARRGTKIVLNRSLGNVHQDGAS
jgi:hypothetical protein